MYFIPQVVIIQIKLFKYATRMFLVLQNYLFCALLNTFFVPNDYFALLTYIL